MKTKSTLPFISLLLIAAMIFAPVIYALEGGSFSTVPDWSGGSFSSSSDGWSGGSFSTASQGWSGGSFGTSADGWSGGSPSDYSGGWSGGSYSTEPDGWSGGTGTSYEPPITSPEPITPPTGSFDYPDITDIPPGGPLPPGEPPLPTNADAIWQDLPDVTIPKASPSGTIIQRDVFSKCSDPDDDYLEFKIATTSDHYELAFVERDLRIFRLNPYYVGSEIITLTCNGAPESFFLHVVQTRTPTQPTETDSDGDGLSVHINTIRLPDYAMAGEQIPITITFKNNGDEKLENVKATVIIQDLAIRASVGPMDLTRGKKASKTLYVELPEDVQPGTYYAKIMIDSNSLHRVKHRELVIA